MSQRNMSMEKRQVILLRVEELYKNGMSIANSCKTVGISVHTYFNWRADPETDARDRIGREVTSAEA